MNRLTTLEKFCKSLQAQLEEARDWVFENMMDDLKLAREC